ncbi:13888_t:CDS:1, partial [Funneliformis geosporum]
MLTEQKEQIDNLNKQGKQIPELIKKLTKLETENKHSTQPAIAEKIIQSGTRIVNSYPLD